MPKSNYLANKFLDLMFGAQSYAGAGGTLYFGLFTSTPSSPTASGTELTIGSNSYARATLTNNLTNLPGASGGVKANGGSAVTWPTATGSWGVVQGVGVYDAASGGNLLFYASISSKTVDSGDTVSIPISGFTATET